MILDSSLLIVTLSIFAPSPCRPLRSTVSQASDSCWHDGMSSGSLHWVTHAKYSKFKIYSSSTVKRIKFDDDDNINMMEMKTFISMNYFSYDQLIPSEHLDVRVLPPQQYVTQFIRWRVFVCISEVRGRSRQLGRRVLTFPLCYTLSFQKQEYITLTVRQSLHYRRLTRLIYRRCVRECIDINQWYSNSSTQSYFSRTDRRYRFSMIHEIRTRSSMTSCFADSEAEQEFFSTNRRLGIYNLCHLRECNDKRIFSRLTECNSNPEFRNTSRLWVSTSPDEGRRISKMSLQI